MNKEQIRAYYQRFRDWQQEAPHYVNRHEGEVQRCHNCGTEFAANFCPICGQRAEVGRVGWKAIRDNITLLWGMDSRSLSYTLVQLLGRPGYFVRDYISGHRQVSFPPVKMLVLVTLFVVIFESVFHVENEVFDIHSGIQKIDNVIAWVNAQKSWATLLFQSLLILPTWLVFRYAPAYPCHTLPEGFFLQVFLSIQALLFSLFGYWSGTAELVLCDVYMYISYWQLFGYRWWGTLWRVAVVALCQMAVIACIISLLQFYFISDAESRDEADTRLAYMVLLLAIIITTAFMLFVTHRINRRTYHHSKEEVLSNL